MRSESQRLFIDGRKLGDGGIGTFIETLIEGLLEYDADIKLVLLVSSFFQEAASEIITKWRSLGVIVEIDNTPKYSFLELFYLPLKWRGLLKKSDWFLSPHYTLPYFIPCRSAVVIHDIIHLQYPENILHRMFAPFLIKSALRRANIVFTVAPHIRKQLEHYRGGKSGRLDICCVPNATEFSRIGGKKETEDYSNRKLRILFVGADRPHKRVLLYLHFLKSLKNAGVSFKGVMVSKIASSTELEIMKLGLREHMEVLQDISKADLWLEYERADLFVTTSVEEGFCIPLLDALAAQVPVLCPDREFSRGLASAAGWFYESESVEDMHRQFAIMVANRTIRDERVKKGQSLSKAYTPREQAKSLLRGLETHE